jgi:uncharacterized protein
MTCDQIPGRVLFDRILDPRGWMGFIMSEGETLRITDIEGKQVADLVCFNSHDPTERLNVHVTVMVQGNLYISTGRSLLSDRCRKLMTITADTCGRHDLLAGSCNEETNFFRFGEHDMPNCRTNLRQALAPYGIPLHQIPPSFNAFMNVSLQPDGAIATVEPLSEAGDYIDLRADTDLIVGISNCPFERGPCNGYHLTPLRVTVFAPSAQEKPGET